MLPQSAVGAEMLVGWEIVSERDWESSSQLNCIQKRKHLPDSAGGRECVLVRHRDGSALVQRLEMGSTPSSSPAGTARHSCPWGEL